MTFAEPVTLTGRLVELSPLVADDHDALVAAASDGELWNLQYTSVPSPANMRGAIDRFLALQQECSRISFVVRLRATGRVIGLTSYLNIEPEHRRLEIGGTWNAASVQRSGTNTESKLLLLGNAFEQLGCIAVEFRTHWLNRQSRAAIERLGAKQDGILRSHRILPDGTLRDTVVYSILAHEWPAVRAELTRSLAAHR